MAINLAEIADITVGAVAAAQLALVAFACGYIKGRHDEAKAEGRALKAELERKRREWDTFKRGLKP
jgi:hypothetical protein